MHLYQVVFIQIKIEHTIDHFTFSKYLRWNSNPFCKIHVQNWILSIGCNVTEKFIPIICRNWKICIKYSVKNIYICGISAGLEIKMNFYNLCNFKVFICLDVMLISCKIQWNCIFYNNIRWIVEIFLNCRPCIDENWDRFYPVKIFSNEIITFSVVIRWWRNCIIRLSHPSATLFSIISLIESDWKFNLIAIFFFS